MLSEAGCLPCAAALVDGVEDDGKDQHAHGRGHAHSGLVGAVLAGPGDDGAVGNHVLSPASLRRRLGYDEPEGHRQNRCRTNGLHAGGRWSSSAGTCSFVLSRLFLGYLSASTFTTAEENGNTLIVRCLGIDRVLCPSSSSSSSSSSFYDEI